MNVLEIARRFPTQESCIEHLERIKWNGKPVCPYCSSKDVVRKKENHLIGRWNCHNCLSSFKVTSGTIFQGTKIPLQKWFAAIAILLNAKKSVSSCQLARDLALTQQSAWYLAMRIRRAMKDDGALLRGIVEADETYLPSHGRRNPPGTKRPGGRSRTRQAVVGAVERGGKVKASLSPRVTAKFINHFLRKNIDPRSILLTDYWAGYNEVRDWMMHERVNHSKEYVRDGYIHTNTIEGFWALVKRAISGQHHHYTLGYADRYIDEASYKYNTRKTETPWDDFMVRAVGAA